MNVKSTKKKIFIVFLIIFFIFLVKLSEAAIYKLKVKVPVVNIRVGPSLTSTIITRALQGTILESDTKQGEWYKVSMPTSKSGEKIYGYVHEGAVEIVEEIKETPKEAKKEPEKIVEKKKEEEQEEVAWVIDKKKKPEEKKEARKEPERIVEKKVEEEQEEVTWVINKKKKSKEIGEEKKAESKEFRLPEIGMKIGYNISSLNMDTIDNLESKSGYCFGGFISFSFNDFLGLEPEIMFTTKGAKETLFNPWNIGTRTWKLSYLEVPLLLKMKFPVSNIFQPYLYGGPYYSIKLSGKLDYSTNGKNSEEQNIEFLKSSDFGLNFGGGLRISIGARAAISLDARYSLGLANILDSDEGSIKTRNFFIIIGFSFNP
jgi:hypothetical protein